MAVGQVGAQVVHEEVLGRGPGAPVVPVMVRVVFGVLAQVRDVGVIVAVEGGGVVVAQAGEEDELVVEELELVLEKDAVAADLAVVGGEVGVGAVVVRAVHDAQAVVEAGREGVESPFLGDVGEQAVLFAVHLGVVAAVLGDVGDVGPGFVDAGVIDVGEVGVDHGRPAFPGAGVFPLPGIGVVFAVHAVGGEVFRAFAGPLAVVGVLEFQVVVGVDVPAELGVDGAFPDELLDGPGGLLVAGGGHVAGRGVVKARDPGIKRRGFLGGAPGQHASQLPVVIGAVAGGGHAGDDLGRLFGDDVNHAAHGIVAVDGGGRAFQDLNALDVFEVDAVPVDVAHVRGVLRHAVDEDQGAALLVAQAAQGHH